MPTDFHPGTDTKAPRKPIKPKLSQEAPLSPRRRQEFDRLIGHGLSETDPVARLHVSRALRAMNPSPEELDYIQHTSRQRGEAMRNAHEGLGGELHALKVVGKGAVGLAANLAGVAGGQEQIGVDAQGKPIYMTANTVFGGVGGSNALKEANELARVSKVHAPRELRHNDLSAQVLRSRSRITQNLIEKPADAVSRALGRSEKAQRIPGVRLATSGERVAKAAGRAQRIERDRSNAALSEHFDALKKVKAGSDEDVAHFWWSQLPSDLRNVHGLTLVRGKQAEELQRVTSGKALEDLTKQEGAVRAKLNTSKERSPLEKAYRAYRSEDNAPDALTIEEYAQRHPELSDVRPAAPEAITSEERFKLLRQLEEIKLNKSDLPHLAKDTAASIARLDRVIAKTPRVNTAVIAAVHNLSGDRQRILEESGRLDQSRAGERRGIVSRWLGLEPTGEEAYVGHRLPRGKTNVGAVPAGTGRPRLPQGVSRENRLILARNGRLRQSVHVAAEDRSAASAFEAANVARGDLAQMGSKFEGHVPEGHVLVNPKGRTIPPQWRTDELANFSDSYGETERARDAAKEMLDGFLAEDPAAIERLKNAALEQGVRWDELRVVPKRLVNRYYSQFRSMKPPRGVTAKTYDAAVDAVATSLIFARLGYVPKNLIQNLVMAVPHQGALLLTNAVRAAQVMKDPELRRLIRAEIGFTGATGAVSREAASQRVVGKVAGAMSKVADDPIRISAFLHEASGAGVIGRLHPLLNEEDRAALTKLLTDKAQRPLLNDIRSRSVEAMADFSRMTPDQARVARRVLIIPGWLMAGSRYPFHFAATHPIRSALLAYIGLGEPGAPDGLHFNRPLDEYFHGSKAAYGIDTPWGRLRTSSLSPVSTPYELAAALEQTAEGKPSPFSNQDTAFNFASPLAAAGVRLSQGEGLKQSLLPLAPNVKLAMDLAHPSATTPAGNPKLFPEDQSRLGRLERELGVLPVKVDPEAEYQARRREGTASMREVDAHEVAKNEKDLVDKLQALSAHGVKVPKVWREAATEAQHLASERDVRYRHAQASLGRKLTYRDRYLITLAVLHENGRMTDAQYKSGRAAADTFTDRQLRHWRDWAWTHLGFGDAGGPGKVLATIHHAYNEKTGQP